MLRTIHEVTRSSTKTLVRVISCAFVDRFVLFENRHLRMKNPNEPIPNFYSKGVNQMRKLIFALTFSLSLCTPGIAQHKDHSTKKDAEERPATHVPGMSSHHHPVSTANPEAQKFFDQGLRFVYAFNHDEAIRSFKRAADLDPQ